jgi:transcriptional regulator NrdR family protein
MNIEILKKDGTKEEFDSEKILNVINAAGASESVAKLVIKDVIENLFRIRSEKLRRLVYKSLKKIDKYAAKNYRKHYIQEPHS